MANTTPVFPDENSAEYVEVLYDNLDLKGTYEDITNRIVKTKAELKAMTSQYLMDTYPAVYEVLCYEDGKSYRIDQANLVENDETGFWTKCDPVDQLAALIVDDGVMGEDVTATSELGYIEPGDVIPADATWQDVVVMITTPYDPPTIDYNFSEVTGVFYNEDDGTVWIASNLIESDFSVLTGSVDITKGSEDITSCNLTLNDSSLVDNIVPQDNISQAINITATTLVDGENTVNTSVSDRRRTTEKSVTILKQGAPVYFGIDGIMDADWNDDYEANAQAAFNAQHPIATYYTEENLDGLQQLTKNTTATKSTLSSIEFVIAQNGSDEGGDATNYVGGTVVFAIPSVFGTVDHLVFGPFNYSDLVSASTTVKGIPYTVYKVDTFVFAYSGTGKIILA